MGILSAVAIAAPAGILNSLIGEKSAFKEQLWRAGPFFVLGASILCTFSAAFFYKERSLLAWYYGQMSLIESLGENHSAPQELKEYMRGADSWNSWIPYSLGFTALFAGFIEYALALFLGSGAFSSFPQSQSSFSKRSCFRATASMTNLGKHSGPISYTSFGQNFHTTAFTRGSSHRKSPVSGCLQFATFRRAHTSLNPTMTI